MSDTMRRNELLALTSILADIAFSSDMTLRMARAKAADVYRRLRDLCHLANPQDPPAREKGDE